MATMLDEIVSNDLLPWRDREGGYAQEWASYKRALARVNALDPELLAFKYGSALNDLDEAVVALSNAAWDAGRAVGDAFARAERSLESEYHVCPRCRGCGRLRNDTLPLTAADSGGPTCLVCGGRGTVPANQLD